MFYEAMLAGGTNMMKAKIMYAGVFLAGPRWDDPERELKEVSGETLTRGFTGAKQWIEKNKPTTIEQIEGDVERREPLLRKVDRFETGISDALQRQNRAHGQELLEQEEALLTRELEKSPDDPMLLNFKGDLHRNRAKLYKMSHDTNRANAELSNSEQLFESVLKIEPRDPSALSGLGGVAILREDLDKAESYAKRAIEIAPGLQGARHDLEIVRERRGGGGPP